MSRKRYPDVDLAGTDLSGDEIPDGLLGTVPYFTVARTWGWLAQWEGNVAGQGPEKIARPRQVYTGYEQAAVHVRARLRISQRDVRQARVRNGQSVTGRRAGFRTAAPRAPVTVRDAAVQTGAPSSMGPGCEPALPARAGESIRLSARGALSSVRFSVDRGAKTRWRTPRRSCRRAPPAARRRTTPRRPPCTHQCPAGLEAPPGLPEVGSSSVANNVTTASAMRLARASVIAQALPTPPSRDPTRRAATSARVGN